MDGQPTNSGQQKEGFVIRDQSDPEKKRLRESSDSENDAETKQRKVDDTVNILPPPTFLTVRHKEENKSLAKVSPFVINKALSGAGGQPKTIKKLRNGRLLIEAKNGKQAEQYLKMKSFYDIAEITVEPHITLNYSRGVIFSKELMECPISELKAELREELVVDVVRIKRKVNGEEVPTSGLILTFAAAHPPDRIRAGYLSLPVRPYFRNPQRCFKCQKFGHSAKNCQNTSLCCRCGQPDHEAESCDNNEKCANCKGEHRADSKTCRVYVEEKEVLKIQSVERISFSEAKREYRSRQVQPPNPQVSYADVVVPSTSIDKSSTLCSSCKKLEGMVLALTEQVAALVSQLSKGTSVHTSGPQASAQTKRPQQPNSNAALSPVGAKRQGNVPARSTGPTAKPNSSTPSHSSRSSVTDDMDTEDPETNAHEKYKKVMKPQQGKIKNKISINPR